MKIRFEAAKNFVLTPELEKYGSKKAKFAVRKLPRAVRARADCTLRFMQTGEAVTCALSLRIGDEVFVAEEATQHAYSSLDIVAAHIEYQLEAYIARHGSKHDWQVP